LHFPQHAIQSVTQGNSSVGEKEKRPMSPSFLATKPEPRSAKQALMIGTPANTFLDVNDM
jgi:hypothetical protein